MSARSLTIAKIVTTMTYREACDFAHDTGGDVDKLVDWAEGQVQAEIEAQAPKAAPEVFASFDRPAVAADPLGR